MKWRSAGNCLCWSSGHNRKNMEVVMVKVEVKRGLHLLDWHIYHPCTFQETALSSELHSFKLALLRVAGYSQQLYRNISTIWPIWLWIKWAHPWLLGGIWIRGHCEYSCLFIGWGCREEQCICWGGMRGLSVDKTWCCHNASSWEVEEACGLSCGEARAGRTSW